MPEMDGIEATRRITTDPSLNGTHVLVLTTFELDEYVFGALDAGASGFLLKGGEPADLVHAIRVIAAGDSLLAPSITRKLINTYTSRPQPRALAAPDGLDELTSREREVLELVAHGLTNAEIATQTSSQSAHCQDPRIENPHEARRARPRPTRRHRLSNRNRRELDGTRRPFHRECR